MKLSTDTIMNIGSEAYRIECLRSKKVLDTRPLWEEVFSEDSKAFTDYYFSEKAPANTAFICRHLPTGQIVSMVHLTPYEMIVQKASVPTFYIVGVATKESHRHKGLMSTLLNKSFDYAARLQCPFVFLMPANPAIYEPFGFSYIYSRPQYSIPSVIGQKEVYISYFSTAGIQIQRLEKKTSAQTLAALADFAGKTLSVQYDYYLMRTPSYYRTLLLELYSQNGCIYTFTLHNRLEGYFLYAEEENRPFIQELLFSDRLRSYIGSLPYVNQNGNILSAASIDSFSDQAKIESDIMSTLFPVPLPDYKPIIMAKNLLSSSFGIPDYVNYLSTHKGFINEIV